MFITENLEEKQWEVTHNLSTYVCHEHYKLFSSIHLLLKIVFN